MILSATIFFIILQPNICNAHNGIAFDPVLVSAGIGEAVTLNSGTGTDFGVENRIEWKFYAHNSDIVGTHVLNYFIDKIRE